MSECKIFSGGLTPEGYGHRWNPYTQQADNAHRVAWMEKRGVVPNGLSVLHTCDTPACIQNEDEGTYTVKGVEHPRQGHLWLGTHQDNMDDMYEKGRGLKARGTTHGMSKLTEEAVRDIRERYRTGEKQIVLAALYGVRQTLISMVVNNQIWKHVK